MQRCFIGTESDGPSEKVTDFVVQQKHQHTQVGSYWKVTTTWSCQIILSMIQDLYTILAEQHTTNLKPPFHYFSYNNKKSHEENNMFSLISIFTWKLNEHFYMWKLNFHMWNCIFTCQKLSLENLTCTLTGKTLKSCHIVSWYEILHPHVVTFI